MGARARAWLLIGALACATGCEAVVGIETLQIVRETDAGPDDEATDDTDGSTRADARADAGRD